ncbi:glycosyltransferase family 39 protein [Candidatus Curtissbacteria bacterium]|nr:glycosyltransferase family 39 protein [Candidatus Curtissbacteria bacterium]
MLGKFKKHILILSVLFIAIFVRTYAFEKSATSLNWDEVSITYNAWSLLETGKDEYGDTLPLVFRSFDDYKSPLYIYLTVPFVAIFGPVGNVVRLPSLILGSFSVLGIYLLTFQLFKKRKIAIFTSLFLALLPWSIHFSRVAFEGNILVFFIIFGIYFFYKFVNGKHNNINISIIFFAIGMYAYHSAKLIIPLIVAILIILYWKQIFSLTRRQIIFSVLLSLILIAPLTYSIFFSGAQKRFEDTSIFSKKNIDQVDPARKLFDIENGNNLPSKLFHNRSFYQLDLLFSNYLSHFSPEFLIYTHDNPRHHATRAGLVLLSQFVFILFGMWLLIKKKKFNKEKILVFSLLLTSPMASALTFEAPHSIRASVLMIPLSILGGLGISWLSKKNNRLQRIILGLLIIFTLVNFYFYYHQYISHYKFETSQDWQFGRKEAVEYTNEVEYQYDEIWISNKLEQSYIYWLLYLKVNPEIYLSHGGTKAGYEGFEENTLGKYRFININPKTITNDKKILLIGEKDEFLAKPIKQILSPNKDTAIDITDSSQYEKINK